ncbi:trace amine-associated receptor 7f-like [Chaetodon trifascialis]|uniref:trace amine-associated receptor 7f-like n=1 Tax=Chaetodon trifascialis TaxID=109706 RepID=UPI0039960B8B
MEAQDGAELCFPELLNTSCQKPKPRPLETALAYSLFIISLVTVVLNLLVIISISHFRQLHTPTNLLLLSLAVTDFLLGLVVLPSEIFRSRNCWFLGDIMCVLLNSLSLSISFASIANIVLISIDRYVAICYPLLYASRITTKRVQACVCLCWLYSFVYNSLLTKDDLAQPGKLNSCSGICLLVIDNTPGIVDFTVTFIVPITAIIFLYTRVFLVVVSQALAMHSQTAVVSLSVTVKTKKSELKAAKALGTVVAVFLMCFFPYHCATLLQDTTDSFQISFIILCINPCLNPMIYALFYSWFRKAIRVIVSLQILQPGSREMSLRRHSQE